MALSFEKLMIDENSRKNTKIGLIETISMFLFDKKMLRVEKNISYKLFGVRKRKHNMIFFEKYFEMDHVFWCIMNNSECSKQLNISTQNLNVCFRPNYWNNKRISINRKQIMRCN